MGDVLGAHAVLTHLPLLCSRQAERCGDSFSHPEGQGEEEKTAAHDTDQWGEETDAQLELEQHQHLTVWGEDRKGRSPGQGRRDSCSSGRIWKLGMDFSPLGISIPEVMCPLEML